MKTAVIIGGGPAGCQCALWLKMLGCDPLILEQTNHLGGLQNQSPYKNNWVVGLINTTGRELAHHIQNHIKSLDIPVIFSAKINRLDYLEKRFAIWVDGHEIHTSTIVLATGLKQRGAQYSSANHYDYDSVTRAFKRSEWEAALPDILANKKDELLDDDGFVLTDVTCQTPIAGIYAIGEIANRMPPCVVTSMADGVVAARAIEERINISSS